MDSGLKESARAKLNLALHVVGHRSDGYHLLDTLVVFPQIADELSARPATVLGLEVEGPFARATPGGEDNLVMRAAHLLRAPTTAGDTARPGAHVGAHMGAHLALTKNLPVEAGIGGGSADAAAALRLLNLMWGCNLSVAGLAALGGALGADVPMCLHSTTLRAGGIGEDIVQHPSLPAIDLVLVNPARKLSTADIFAALPDAKGAGIGDVPPGFDGVEEFAAYLKSLRNDLEAPASARAPEITTALKELRACSGCLLARMSGSGPTIFGIFTNAADAVSAASAMAARHAQWWIVATRTD